MHKTLTEYAPNNLSFKSEKSNGNGKADIFKAQSSIVHLPNQGNKVHEVLHLLLLKRSENNERNPVVI